MKKYNEEYFSVVDKITGKKICDCSDEMDALMMVSFNPGSRTITKNKFMMGQVIDIEIPKSLPTTDFVVAHNANSEKIDDYNDNILESNKSKLPEGQGLPVII